MGLVPLNAGAMANWPINKGMLRACSSIKTAVFEALCDFNHEECNLDPQHLKNCAKSTVTLVYCSAGMLLDFEQVWSEHMYDIASELYSAISKWKPTSVLEEKKKMLEAISGRWSLPLPRRQTVSKVDMELKKKFMDSVVYKH